MADRVIRMPGVESQPAHELAREAPSLVDLLRVDALGDVEMQEFVDGVAEAAGAICAALFLLPEGARDPSRAARRAVHGIDSALTDRVTLPRAIAAVCGVPGVTRAVGNETADPQAIGRIFPPLRRSLTSGLIVGMGSPRRTAGVLALGFDAPPAPELAAALAQLAWRCGSVLEADLLAREADAGEKKYRLLMSGAADAITLYDPAEDRLVDCNLSAEEMFRRSREELLDVPPLEVLAYLRTASLTEVDPSRPREGVVALPDGSEQPFEVTSRVVRMHGRALILSIYRDLRDRRKAEAALRASEERYALAVEGANDGLWDWDVGEGVVYFSPRWKAMLGYGGDEVGSTPGEWFRRIHPDDLERMRAAISAHLEGLTPHFEDEHRIRRKDGSYVWVLSRGLAVRDNNGWAVRMAGSMTDVTQRKVAEERLLHAAFHDGLTGLPNRALFMDRLSQIVARARRRSEDRFAVLFLDLDRFKVVNDSLGHSVGDQLLVAIARRLERCLRPADTVARLGGDEFTVLLEDVGDLRGATRVADRIHVELIRPFKLAGQEVFTSASIGIALGGSTEDPEMLLRNADLAMYQAKANGKARHEVFDHEMHAHAMQLMKLETSLRKGLERGEFRVHYQPLIALTDGRLHGFEALVRWEHPERGLLAPGAFLEVAEETGLIVPLGGWVLREACGQMSRWHRATGRDDLTVSVNLAGHQLAQPNLVEEVEAALHDVRLDPRNLSLEITENAVMERADESTRTLRKLKDLGIRLHMDDFGTGLASLAYLRRFPVDTLKIDRSFVSRMTEDAEDAAIIRTIVTLARSLKLGVIAEGIETVEHLRMLKELGCDLGQGYLFDRPLAPADAATRLQEGTDWPVN